MIKIISAIKKRFNSKFLKFNFKKGKKKNCAIKPRFRIYFFITFRLHFLSSLDAKFFFNSSSRIPSVVLNYVLGFSSPSADEVVRGVVFV